MCFEKALCHTGPSMGSSVLNKRGAACVKKGTGNVFLCLCLQTALLVGVFGVCVERNIWDSALRGAAETLLADSAK